MTNRPTRKTTKKGTKRAEKRKNAEEAIARVAESLIDHATAIRRATLAELLKRAQFVENCAHHIRWAAEDLTEESS